MLNIHYRLSVKYIVTSSIFCYNSTLSFQIPYMLNIHYRLSVKYIVKSSILCYNSTFSFQIY